MTVEPLVQKRYLTQFAGEDGCRYAGPIVQADCLDAARAIVQTCLLGPTGQSLTVLGELVYQETEDLADTRSHVRRVS